VKGNSSPHRKEAKRHGGGKQKGCSEINKRNEARRRSQGTQKEKGGVEGIRKRIKPGRGFRFEDLRRGRSKRRSRILRGRDRGRME